MKSVSKVPFKGKKTPYNLNEVDVNLLLKNPSHIRKVVKGNYKEENNYDEDESEEEDEKESEDDKLDAHMRRYISEYFDNKYKEEKKGHLHNAKKNLKLYGNESHNFIKNHVLKEFKDLPKDSLPRKPSSISENLDHIVEKADKTIGNIKKYPHDLMTRAQKKNKYLKSNVLKDLTKEEFEKLKKEHLEEQVKNKSFLRHKNIIPGIELIDSYMIMNKEAKKRLKEREKNTR